MRFGLILALACLLAVGSPSLAAPLETYGHLPQIEDAQISPDGQLIALSVTDGEHRNVVIRRVGETNALRVVVAGTAKLRSIQWAGSSHLLISASQTTAIMNVIAPRAEYAVTTDYDVAHRTQRTLFRGLEHVLNITELGPYVSVSDGHPVAVVGGVQFVDGAGRLSLFRTNLDGNNTIIEETGFRDTRDWVVDASGRAIAALEVNDQSGRWTVRVRAPGGGWREAQASPVASEQAPNLIGLGRDGVSVLVSLEQDDSMRLREISLVTGAWGEALGESGASGPLFDPATHRLVGLSRLVGDTYTRSYFDAADQRRWNGLIAAFPGQHVSPVSASEDHNRVIALVDSPTEGAAYALVDFTTGHATWIGGLYRGITPDDVSPVTYVTYHAADGLPISGYLTLPRGRDPHHLPLVVLPHGGPEARDTSGFDWWAQALASRGYAVLQPNFRGSSGYGMAFVRAGFGQWGRKMQTDLSDGVRYLANEGTIDPARVCIIGASYGGYAALAGATMDHGVYRCAEAVGGVSDPGSLIAYARSQQGRIAQRYWIEFMGVTGPRDPALAAISPLAQAAHADAPILLVHGRDDTVVPFSQSSNMAAALQRAGRPVQLVDLRSEDHWLSRGETRLRMLTEVVRFLEANNPPTGAPAAR